MNEPEPEPTAHRTDARRLSHLMTLDEGARPVWEPGELSAILQHQLAAPFHLDLGGSDDASAAIRSFGDLLHHPHPPLKLLELTRQFAKASAQHPDHPLPREIALLLYYASILVARLRHGQRISRLDDATLRRGLNSLLTLPWVDEKTRGLLREGLENLR